MASGYSWNDYPSDRLKHFEVRVGRRWNGAQVVHQGSEPAFLHELPPVAQMPYWVAPVAKSGLYGSPVSITPASVFYPPEVVEEVKVTDLEPGGSAPTGTHTNTEFADGVIRLATDQRSGTYVSPELDLGFQAIALWRVTAASNEVVEIYQEDLGTISARDGEAWFWTVDGRPPSPGIPGVDWENDYTQATLPVWTKDTIPGDRLVLGPRGTVGAHTFVNVESRFYDEGAWSVYAPHKDGWRRAQKMQVRLTLNRSKEVQHRRITDLVLAVGA